MRSDDEAECSFRGSNLDQQLVDAMHFLVLLNVLYVMYNKPRFLTGNSAANKLQENCKVIFSVAGSGIIATMLAFVSRRLGKSTGAIACVACYAKHDENGLCSSPVIS